MARDTPDASDPFLESLKKARPKKASKKYLHQMQALVETTREILERGTVAVMNRNAPDPPSRKNNFNVEYVPLSETERAGAECTLKAAEQEVVWAAEQLRRK